MKKGVISLTLCFCFVFFHSFVHAENLAQPSAYDWEISIQPKPTQEEIERDRWSYVFANDIGIYAFDNQSLCIDKVDKTLVHVLIKTIFTDPKTVNNLSEKYRKKLNESDQVSYVEMQIVFQLKEKTYAVLETKVVSEQGNVVDDIGQSARYVTVSPKTFAETMYDIARNYEKNK